MERIDVTYVALFDYAEDGINITFPDIPEAVSCAYSTEEAMVMAREALELALHGKEIDSLPEARIDYIGGIPVSAEFTVENGKLQCESVMECAVEDHRINWRLNFFAGLFAFVLVILIKVLPMLFNGEVVDEDGVPLGIFGYVIGILLCIVCSSYLFSLISIIKQHIVHKGLAFRITPNGIEDTLIFGNFLAFYFILPVKLIPWEAVRYVDDEHGLYIRMKTDKVKAGIISKIFLRVMGYSFLYSMIKPKLSEKEIACIRGIIKKKGNVKEIFI